MTKSTKEATFSRGEGGASGLDLRGVVEQKMQQILETPREELAEPLFWWDVFAIGPFQTGAVTIPPGTFFTGPLLPHRIIQVGEEATIFTVVLLNPFFPTTPPSACDIIAGFGAKIELNYFTANTQTMQPVSALSAHRCFKTVIDPVTGQPVCFYVDEFKFTPQEPACLYETNICARLCNCEKLPIRPFGAFVRWIADLDADLIFGSPGLEFNNPVRYMVTDLKSGCQNCPD